MLLTSSFNIFKFPEILNLYLSKGCEATHAHNFLYNLLVPYQNCTKTLEIAKLQYEDCIQIRH